MIRSNFCGATKSNWIFAATFAGLFAIGCGGSSGGAVDARDSGGDRRDTGTDGGGTGGGFGGSGGGFGGSGGGTGGTGGGTGGTGGGTGGSGGGTGGNAGRDGGPDAPDTADVRPDVPDVADVPVEMRPETAVDVPAERPADRQPDMVAERPADAPVDRPGCGANGVACRRMGGQAGLCQNNMCVACADPADDARCVTAYGAMHLCVAGACVPGNCRASSTCAAGQLCGVPTANLCGSCASDGQCQADTRYGANFICNTTTGMTDSGKCVAATCTTNSTACAANTSDFCCAGKCVAGNCCNDNDCRNNPAFGQFFACSANHMCSQCASATGNQYLVDPVGGNDATATGSGKAGTVATASCSFKTITRALQVIGNAPPTGTTITIVGRDAMVTVLYTTSAGVMAPVPEVLPILVPANVKITTTGGAITVNLPAAATGAFQLTANNASIVPDGAARMTIDGSLNVVASAILSKPGTGNTSSIGNLSILNTGDHGIVVTDGTLNIGPGVSVRSAGRATTNGRRSGLFISGGTAIITVPATAAQTSFNNNTANGIRVDALGTLNVTGVSTGTGTVVANSNFMANLLVSHTPGMAPAVSTINGIIASNSSNGEGGIQILGGSRVKLRNSIALGNAASGVVVMAADATAAGNALAGIDLGTGTADFGHNVLAAAPGSNPNLGAGLCVRLGMNAGAQTLNATGNVFAGPRDCSAATPGATTKATSCAGIADEAVEPATGTTVTVVRTNCL